VEDNNSNSSDFLAAAVPCLPPVRRAQRNTRTSMTGNLQSAKFPCRMRPSSQFRRPRPTAKRKLPAAGRRPPVFACSEFSFSLSNARPLLDHQLSGFNRRPSPFNCTSCSRPVVMSDVGACTISVTTTATTCAGSSVVGGGDVLVQSIGCGVDSQKY